MSDRYESFTFSAFRKLSKEFGDFLDKSISAIKLSPNEVVVLTSLDKICSASEIATNFGVSKALISRSVKRLKNLELLSVTISSVDKREQILALTDSGKEIAKLAHEAVDEFFARAYNDFSHDEKEVLTALLSKMLANLAEDDIDEI